MFSSLFLRLYVRAMFAPTEGPSPRASPQLPSFPWPLSQAHPILHKRYSQNIAERLRSEGVALVEVDRVAAAGLGEPSRGAPVPPAGVRSRDGCCHV